MMNIMIVYLGIHKKNRTELTRPGKGGQNPIRPGGREGLTFGDRLISKVIFEYQYKRMPDRLDAARLKGQIFSS